MKKRIIHIVCYSGGHSSAIVAIEVVRRYGKDNVILLNHNINPRYEDADVKRFKKEVADYLGLPITYANIDGIKDENLIPSQFDVCEKKGSFVNPHTRDILCTYALKTQPFYNYLSKLEKDSICAYYGFDDDELNRVERRKTYLNDDGIQSDFPLALWGEGKFKSLEKYFADKKVKDPEVMMKVEKYINRDHYKRTIFSTTEIGVLPPLTYKVWKHANCVGCLKAGQQHWYCVYVHDRETFNRGKLSEERIAYSFGKEFLKDLEPKFELMLKAGLPASEHIPSGQFWSNAKAYLNRTEVDLFPCHCFEK